MSVRPEPMIACRDLAASTAFYERLLGVRNDHGGDEYGCLVDGDTVVLQLHHWNAPEHPNLGDPDSAPPGYGVLFYVRVDDVDAVARRADEMGAEVVEPLHKNLLAGHREVVVRDPDGYYVAVAGPYGS